MNLSLFIARKYFNSKNNKNFINVISIIAMVGVALGTMALVIVLSVMNGLKENIRALYGTFDPEIKIEAREGKTFEMSSELKEKLSNIEGVAAITEIVEDNALLEYQDSQIPVKVKGVDENFSVQNKIADHIVEGEFRLKKDNLNYILLGRSIERSLGIAIGNEFRPLKLYYPKDVRIGNIDPTQLFNTKNILPGGVFQLDQNNTEEYVFVPLDFALNLFNFDHERTSLEIKTSEGFSVRTVQQEIRNALGEDFLVLNGDEQHASLLKAIKVEKLFVFVVFSFVLAIASFNTFFALTMLGIEKKKDMAILYSMGASRKLIKKIFLAEGGIIALTGAGIGLILGLIFLILQQEVGVISLGMQTSVLQAYPVKMELMDFILTVISIMLITLIASYRPAWMSSRIKIGENL